MYSKTIIKTFTEKNDNFIKLQILILVPNGLTVKLNSGVYLWL
jgi:hypothetical protein